jgi:xanthine dehydrogenase YagS FAD-binding subunit
MPMNRFEYHRVSSPEEAARELAGEPGASLLAGGTDLIPLMKEDLVSPLALIDLSGWNEGTRIEETSEGLRIGSLASLSSLASHPAVRSRYSALADACSLAAAPQLRNMGTIGGNLLQQTRCWYFRGPFNCWLKGGETCFAREGENEQHSIFCTDPSESKCVSAHPSDPAAALLALDATVEYVSGQGAGMLSMADLYALPTAARRSFTTLPPDAVITNIVVPKWHQDTQSLYRKSMVRATWAFALAGIALVVRWDRKIISECRIVLSGVAPIPLRMESAEDAAKEQKIDELDLEAIGEALTVSARPLGMNQYKVGLVAGLCAEAFRELAKSSR